MRNKLPIVASMTALLTLAASAPVHAQAKSDSSQSVPDAPQPQKKPAAKPQSSDSGSQSTDKTNAQTSDSSSPPADKTTPPSTKDENPFPETVSKEAAKAADGSSTTDHPADSDAASPKHPPATDNPFPESVSRDAAKAAGNDPAPAPAAKSDLPPGVSSSQSGGGFGAGENEPGAPNQLPNPARAKRDAEVGGFYLKTGDYKGALLRYKDATTSDPTNVEAIFGLAETQRMLKQNAEAARNYQLYLDIVPNGPRAKQALKALKTLGSGG